MKPTLFMSHSSPGGSTLMHRTASRHDDWPTVKALLRWENEGGRVIEPPRATDQRRSPGHTHWPTRRARG